MSVSYIERAVTRAIRCLLFHVKVNIDIRIFHYITIIPTNNKKYIYLYNSNDTKHFNVLKLCWLHFRAFEMKISILYYGHFYSKLI